LSPFYAKPAENGKFFCPLAEWYTHYFENRKSRITANNIKIHSVDESIDYERDAFPVEKKAKKGEKQLLPKIPFFGIWGRLGGGLFTVYCDKFLFY
jgi:hypothetical protein